MTFKLGSDTAILSLVAPAGGLELTTSGLRLEPTGNSSLRLFLVNPQEFSSVSGNTILTGVEHNMSTGSEVTISEPEVAVSSTVYASGQYTITTSSAHGYSTGDM